MAERYRTERASPVSLDNAIEAAARRRTRSHDVRALQAEILVLYFRGEVDAALAVGGACLRDQSQRHGIRR